jgi:hypothetical protein
VDIRSAAKDSPKPKVQSPKILIFKRSSNGLAESISVRLFVLLQAGAVILFVRSGNGGAK